MRLTLRVGPHLLHLSKFLKFRDLFGFLVQCFEMPLFQESTVQKKSEIST